MRKYGFRADGTSSKTPLGQLPRRTIPSFVFSMRTFSILPGSPTMYAEDSPSSSQSFTSTFLIAPGSTDVAALR